MSKPTRDHGYRTGAAGTTSTTAGLSQARMQVRRAKKRQKRTRQVVAIVAALVLLAAVGIGGYLFYRSLPITVEIDNTQKTMPSGTTLVDLLDQGLVDVKTAGDLLAVDGSVLEAGGGDECLMNVNGQDTQDRFQRLNNGDKVVFSDGQDVEEDSDQTQTPIPFTYEKQGQGSLACITRQGTDGVSVEKTGKVSGKTVTQVTEPINAIVTHYNPVPEEKLMALTFDDGPGPFSQQILDTLERHGAKATFFLQGTNVDKVPEMVQTMVAKGHQVATHSYWHNDMTTISEDGVHQEWQSSEESIEAAGGVKTTVGRAPYGSFGLREWKASGDVLSLLVGWNIDSNDWNAPSAQSIVDEVISHASSGDIVLFHDGGAKREKTVEALDTLLPQLQEMGYRFVTVDELYALCPPPE